jgi:hypothetical protein
MIVLFSVCDFDANTHQTSCPATLHQQTTAYALIFLVQSNSSSSMQSLSGIVFVDTNTHQTRYATTGVPSLSQVYQENHLKNLRQFIALNTSENKALILHVRTLYSLGERLVPFSSHLHKKSIRHQKKQISHLGVPDHACNKVHNVLGIGLPP